MGSECESKDLEVKKAHTRTRSKQKQKRKEDSTELIASGKNDSEVSDETSNGAVIPDKKRRAKKSLKMLSASSAAKTETDESTNTDESRKTRQGKRLANQKDSSQNETNAQGQIPKKQKKKSAGDAKEEPKEDRVSDTDEEAPKKPSNRQVKRENAKQRVTLKKETSKLEATEKALNYVSKWKHARSQWKFEKLRQIWLTDNLLDADAIPDEIFPTVLEYFEGCKGMAREQLLKKGMDVIKKQEENEEATENGAEVSNEYKRARQLLQALPTEA